MKQGNKSEMSENSIPCRRVRLGRHALPVYQSPLIFLCRAMLGTVWFFMTDFNTFDWHEWTRLPQLVKDSKPLKFQSNYRARCAQFCSTVLEIVAILWDLVGAPPKAISCSWQSCSQHVVCGPRKERGIAITCTTRTTKREGRTGRRKMHCITVFAHLPGVDQCRLMDSCV